MCVMTVIRNSTVPWQRALKPTMAVKTSRSITNFIFFQKSSLSYFNLNVYLWLRIANYCLLKLSSSAFISRSSWYLISYTMPELAVREAKSKLTSVQ